MNTTVVTMLLIVIHVLVCVLMCVLSRFGVLRVEGRLLPFMLLVPLWGPLCVLLLHVRTLIRAGEHTAPDLEQMRVDDEERRSILVEERADFVNTVPLEEALIVNDSRSASQSGDVHSQRQSQPLYRCAVAGPTE